MAMNAIADARDAELDEQRYPQQWVRFACPCGFSTRSRLRWWLHRVRAWPVK